MKRIISLLLLLLFFATTPYAEPSKAENWYIKKGNNGDVPTFPPSAEYIRTQNGFFVDSAAIENDRKVIYLTFDAGYENGNIERILDIMKEKQVTGAFFILSNLINKNPDLVKRMVNEGHTVCNHTTNHKDLTTLTNEEVKINISQLEDQFENLTGNKMDKYFRFPEGRYNSEKIALCNELGYRCVFWSAAYADWDNERQPDTEWAFNKLMSQTHPGAIYLLHPTSKTNADILSRLIDAWQNMGYEIRSIKDIA